MNEFERSLDLVISHGVAQGLTYLQIQNALVESLARVTVAAASTKRELEDATEVVRHTLDQRITHYDNYTRHANTD